MDEIKIDFTDVKKTLEELEDCPTTELAMHQKVRRMIYYEAKKYTSREIAKKIANDCMDYLISWGISIHR